MTPKQIELARHALGLTQGRKQSFRNHFVTGEGSIDYPHWKAMVESGYAKRWPGSPLTGGDDLFRLTFKGASAALMPGERLCPEDFKTEQPTQQSQRQSHRRDEWNNSNNCLRE